MTDKGNSSREVFRFSFSKKTHQDVIDAIESVPRPFRSEFIARAVRHMLGNMNSVFFGTGSTDYSAVNQKHKAKAGGEIDISKTFKF